MPTPPEAPPGGSPGRRPCRQVPGPPLPDPAAVQLHVIPPCTPPYDDELSVRNARAGQSAGPAHPTARTGSPRPPAGDEPARTGSPRPPAGDEPARPGAGQPAGGRPHPVTGQGQSALPGQFARVLVETLAGARPPRQLTSWTTERARSRIQRMGPLLTAGQRPRLRRVVARHPAADVIEMTVLLSVGPEIKAVAVRLEHTGPRAATRGRPTRPGRWLCTQVEAA